MLKHYRKAVMMVATGGLAFIAVFSPNIGLAQQFIEQVKEEQNTKFIFEVDTAVYDHRDNIQAEALSAVKSTEIALEKEAEQKRLKEEEKTKAEELHKQRQIYFASYQAPQTTPITGSDEWSTGQASAYSCTPGECSGDPNITASGQRTREGIIAAPPQYPFGTKIEFADMNGNSYGIYEVADRGGSIQGSTFDIFMPNVNDAYAWGRRTIQFRIVG